LDAVKNELETAIKNARVKDTEIADLKAHNNILIEDLNEKNVIIQQMAMKSK
jgi:hypothetical protein